MDVYSIITGRTNREAGRGEKATPAVFWRIYVDSYTTFDIYSRLAIELRAWRRRS